MVIGLGHVLKVFQAVVGALAVFVVDLLTIRTRANECGGNQPMDAGCLEGASVLKLDHQVPAAGCIWAQDSFKNRTVLGLSGETLNSPEVTNLIDPLPPADRTPLLGFHAGSVHSIAHKSTEMERE